jgi:hypothetical protein
MSSLDHDDLETAIFGGDIETIKEVIKQKIGLQPEDYANVLEIEYPNPETKKQIFDILNTKQPGTFLRVALEDLKDMTPLKTALKFGANPNVPLSGAHLNSRLPVEQALRTSNFKAARILLPLTTSSINTDIIPKDAKAYYEIYKIFNRKRHLKFRKGETTDWQVLCAELGTVPNLEQLNSIAKRLGLRPKSSRREICADLARDFEGVITKKGCKNETNFEGENFDTMQDWKVIKYKDERGDLWCFTLDEVGKLKGINPYTTKPLPQFQISPRAVTRAEVHKINPQGMNESQKTRMIRYIVDTIAKFSSLENVNVEEFLKFSKEKIIRMATIMDDYGILIDLNHLRRYMLMDRLKGLEFLVDRLTEHNAPTFLYAFTQTML